MKTNRNIEKYRESLKVKLLEYQKSLDEVESELKTLIQEYNKKTKEKSMVEMMAEYSKTFSEITLKKQECVYLVEKVKLDLLEKKYANQRGYSDIEPYEVIEERTPNLYIIRGMKSVQTEESKQKMKESFMPGDFHCHFDNFLQDWIIEPDEEGRQVKVRRHKDGKFYDSDGQRYEISEKPIKFYDFNV